MGAGRSEFAMSVFGRSYGQKISCQALMHGKPVDVSTINKAMDAGIAYVTEDRKRYGLVLIDDIKGNVSLANLDGISRRAGVGAPRGGGGAGGGRGGRGGRGASGGQ